MIPALIVSYIVSVVFSNGQYQGLSALSEFNMLFSVLHLRVSVLMFRTIIRCVSIQPFTSTKNVVDCPE